MARQDSASAAGRPYTVTIAGHQTVELHNALVGDVWLCGVQSNMALSLRAARNADDEIKSANYPNIRFFTVGGKPAYHRVDTIDGKWSVVSPESAGSLSAAGYHFARRLEQEIHVPIGLVVDAVGGTPAEAWTSAAALRPLHDFDVPRAELDRHFVQRRGPSGGALPDRHLAREDRRSQTVLRLLSPYSLPSTRGVFPIGWTPPTLMSTLDSGASPRPSAKVTVRLSPARR
ncbi:MAG TPA: hypothetical protein VKU01_27755 [Bryobacteraceae bacterium]|nr:hypothetical protein [Bryobacteraceae bacterium]